MTTVADRLSEQIRDAGIKPTCEAAGVPRATVMRWLRGGGDLKLAQADALAAAMGLRLWLSEAESR